MISIKTTEPRLVNYFAIAQVIIATAQASDTTHSPAVVALIGERETKVVLAAYHKDAKTSLKDGDEWAKDVFNTLVEAIDESFRTSGSVVIDMADVVSGKIGSTPAYLFEGETDNRTSPDSGLTESDDTAPTVATVTGLPPAGVAGNQPDNTDRPALEWGEDGTPHEGQVRNGPRGKWRQPTDEELLTRFGDNEQKETGQ